MEATGPADRRMICRGIDILYAKAQLFKRFTDRKYAV
jgi:hypothetical protein